MAQFLITAPDGQKFTVTGPNGATEQQALEHFQSQWRGIDPPEASSEVGDYKPITESSAPDASTIGGAVTQFGTGFNRKLGAGIGLLDNYLKRPIDMLGDQAIGMLTGRPVQPRPAYSNPVTDLANSAPAPAGPGERIAGRAGEEFGNALTVAGPLYGLAQSGIRAGTSLGGQVVNRVLDSMRAAPGAAAVGDVVATAGSGAGAGLMQEAAPGSQAAEVTGQIVGSLAPAAVTHGVVGTGVRTGNYLWGRYFSKTAREGAARDQAAKVLGGELTPSAAAGLREGEALQADMPGFQPTMAEQTGAPSMVAVQRKLEGQAQGADLEKYASRRAGSEQAVEQFAATNAPRGIAGDEGPEFVMDTASGRIERLRVQLGRAQSRLDEAATENAARAPMGRPAASGETMRGVYETARKEAREDMGALADNLGISNSNVSIPFTEWRERLIAELAPQTKFTRQPKDLPYLRSVLSDMERDTLDQGITFKDIKALRERVSDDITTAMRGSYSGQNKDVAQLVLVRKRVDDLIDDLAANGAPNDPTLAARYKQFRDTYRSDFIERFEKGSAFKVHERDARGFYRNDDEAVAAAFWSPGKVTSLRQFNRVFGNDPDANQALVDVALDSLHRATVRSGKVDGKALATWQREHADLLDERPDIARLVGNISERETALAGRQAQLDGRAKQIEDSTLNRLVARVEKGGITPEQAIEAALRDPRKMMKLTHGISANPDAKAALARHVWDRAAYMDSGDMLAFLTQHRPSLTVALGEKHVRDLEKIQAARTMLDRVPAPTGQAFDPNPLRNLEGATGMNVSQLASRYVNVASGRLSARVAGADAFGRFWRNLRGKQSADLLREANYNPAVARDLADLATAPMQADSAIGRIAQHMAKIGRPILMTAGRVGSDMATEE